MAGRGAGVTGGDPKRCTSEIKRRWGEVGKVVGTDWWGDILIRLVQQFVAMNFINHLFSLLSFWLAGEPSPIMSLFQNSLRFASAPPFRL